MLEFWQQPMSWLLYDRQVAAIFNVRDRPVVLVSCWLILLAPAVDMALASMQQAEAHWAERRLHAAHPDN